MYDPMLFNNIYCQDLSAPYGVLVVPGDAKVSESVEVQRTDPLSSDVVAVTVHTLQLHDAKMHLQHFGCMTQKCVNGN